jgi:hypothetical protein
MGIAIASLLLWVSSATSVWGQAVPSEGDSITAQTLTDNSQLNAGSVGGGTGPLTVTNQHSSSITDTSAANATTGLSVALAPTRTSSAAAPSGVISANSGASTATGIAAQNNVTTSSAVAVQVNGASTAPVNVTSNSAVSVQNQGAADASTGAAWAVAAGANGSPSGVATPAVAGAISTTSSAASATGLQANTALANRTDATITSAGGRTNTAAINITPDQSVAAENWGVGVAKSGAACVGAACGISTGTTGTVGASGVVGATQSASGTSTAQGLTAQNQVSTDAQVAVTVKGRNYAPINVVVDSLTHLFNVGVARSASGSSVATGASGSGASTQPAIAASGAAQALGANVQNSVDLASAAKVRVNGDNYSPIDIVLQLAADLINWGTGLATSGDAQSQGASGGGTSTTGPATAQGLAVVNVVRMWADADVDIEGDNYAPITIQIHFRTNIDNRGLAIAQSGNTAAGRTQTAGSPSTVSGGASGGATASGDGYASTSATGGKAIAVSNSANAQIGSVQLSSADAGTPIRESVVTILNQLPPGIWRPRLNQNLGTTDPPAARSGLNSASGDSTARGLHSDIVQSNTQLVACADPGATCTARNSATLSSRVSDLPTNPASPKADPGGTSAVSGDALVNATPTPTPKPTGQQGTSQSGSSGRRATAPSQQFQETVTRTLAATGHVVVLDLWSNLPGRRLPPMPNPDIQTPGHSNVAASLGDEWPASDELPIPDLSGPPTLGIAPSSARLPRPAASADSVVEPDDEDVPLLGVYDFDPWSDWPQVEDLPMPLQTTLAHVAAPEALAEPETAVASPAEDGALPTDFRPAAAVALAFGVLAGIWRSRRVLRSWSQTARALALVRIGLSSLRFW